MEDKLKTEIAAIIKDIFDSKQESEMRKRTEKALNESASTIEELTSKLETLEEELAGVKTDSESIVEQKEEVEKKVAELEKEVEEAAEKASKEVEELKKQIEEKTSELEEKASELEDIRKEAVAKERMEVLTTAGVVREDKEGQQAKVKEMSDEEFKAYKEELESIKTTIMASLKDGNSKEGSEEELEEGSEGVKTTPANIDLNNVASAAFNMESYPSEDLLDKYRDLGNALAESMKKE